MRKGGLGGPFGGRQHVSDKKASEEGHPTHSKGLAARSTFLGRVRRETGCDGWTRGERGPEMSAQMREGRVQIVQDFVGHGRGFPCHWRDFKQGRAEGRFTFLLHDSGCPPWGDRRAREEKRTSR